MQCAVAEEIRLQRKASLEIVHPKRRFEQVAIDVQTITLRTKAGNIKILVMIDVFTRFVRAVPIPDEKADTVAKVVLEDCIGLFGPMEKFMSDGGTNLVSKVVENLVERLGIGRMQTCPWHPQFHGTVERWNRTVAKEIASFMTTGESDWDEHVALACLRYITSSHTATGMTPFEAMFGIQAFEAWGEVDLEGVEEESEDLPKRLAALHKTLLSRGRNARLRGKTQYDKVVHETVFNVGDRVLMWSTKLGKDEGKKIIRPWTGPYVIKQRLGRVGFELESEVGAKRVHVHVNRLRRIGPEIVETGDPEHGVFPDSLRFLKRITACETRRCRDSDATERWFKVRIHGRRSATWTRETDLPETVVKLFESSSQSRLKSQENKQNPIGNPTDAERDEHDANWCEQVFLLTEQ